MIRRWLVAILLPLLAAPAGAFDLMPEFHALSESEAPPVGGLDATTLIDSEYQSDVVTYILPLQWESEIAREPRALALTLGSLSNKLFLQHEYLKFSKRLAPGLELRFSHFIQRDLDRDQRHEVIELVQDLGPRLALSVYGEPSFAKRENDIGAALLLRPRERHEIRLFHTWVDFTRQEHNDRPDYFVRGSEPRSMGVVGRCEGCFGARESGVTEISNEATETRSRRDHDWLEYFARWETPTRWRLPLQSLEYGYEAQTAGVKARLAPTALPGGFLNLRLQATRKFEGLTPQTGGAGGSLDKKLFESLASVELPASGAATIEPGLGYFTRDWQAGASSLRHRNLVSFVQFKINRFHLGYEITSFTSDGDRALAANELKTEATEHRANFRYVWELEDRAELTVALTGDVDAALGGSGGLFEGGNGQFRVFF